MENKISIIVPVYNAEKYLNACLDSILRQTYNNLQVILVDDGSTDTSGEICDKYVSLDNRFEVYHQENKGQAAARNLGLSRASGEWIGFVDNDDIVEETMYEVLLSNAIENHLHISGCATNTVYEDGSSKNKFADISNGIKDGDDLILDILYQTSHAWGAMWNKIYHKSLIEQLKYPDGYQLEDYWVSIRLYHEVKDIYFDNRPLYNWYQRSTSQSHKLFGTEKLTIFEMAEKIKTYCLLKGDKQLAEGGCYFSFICYMDLIEKIYKYGDADTKRIAKQKVQVAMDNLKNINKINSRIKMQSLVKRMAKLNYYRFKMRNF